jgi:hypothetical protein
MFGNQKPQILDTLTLPLDKTGTSTANLVIDEVQSISSINAHKNFLLIPELAPFFLNNLVLQYDNGSTITTLTSGVDYAPAMLDTVATLMCGKSVYKAISIFDVNKNGNIAVTYQSLGGSRAANVPDITAILAGKGRNSRIIDWSGVQNIPAGLNPSQHLEDIANIKGQDLLIASIAALNNVLFNRPTINLDVNVSLGVLTLITPPPLNIGVFNASFIMFMGGQYNIPLDPAKWSAATEKYTFNTNTFVTAGNLSFPVYYTAATSTNQFAFLFGGSTTIGILNSTQKYLYSNDASILSFNMTYATDYAVGAGNSIIAIEGSGVSLASTQMFNSTSVYTYSSDSAVAGANLAYYSFGGGCAGNANLAIFAGGSSNYIGGYVLTNVSCSYTYSNNTSAAWASLSTPYMFGSAAANTVTGVFFSGYAPPNYYLNVINISNFSNNTMTQAGSLSYTNWTEGSAGDAVSVIIKGGYTFGQFVNNTASSLFSYSSNTAVTSNAIGALAAASQAVAGPCLGVNY